MKIELWSDYVCPYCYIGERNLETALKALSDKENVEIVYKSFQLDPDASYETTTTTKERVAKKYGYTMEQAQQMIDSVNSYANSVGLDYHYATTLYTNTFDAHRLAKYAATKGKCNEISEKLFHAYFVENEIMSDHKLLTDIAVEIGLDKSEVEEVLKNEDKFAADVRRDEEEAYSIGVRAVPFFLIDGKYTIAGAQSAEGMLRTLERVLADNKEK